MTTPPTDSGAAASGVTARRWAAAALLAYWVALFIGTHIPTVPQAIHEVASDKTLHYLAYGGLSFLLAVYWNTITRLDAKRLLLVFALVAVYGAADEILQIFVGRNADVADWIADVLGAASGLAAFVAVRATLTRLLPVRS